jgi:glycerophosphoryl diester phosphodiesterase
VLRAANDFVRDGRADSPLIVAHRGASAGSPDNSIAAFERAIAAGADMIEFDVRRTRDGELIAWHDATVDGRLAGSMSRAEIGAATGVVPVLVEEVVELARGRIGLDVELKEAGYLDLVVPLLTEGIGQHEVVVTSFLDDVVAELKTRVPAARVGLLLGVAGPRPYLRARRSELDPVDRARRCHADFVAPHVALARFGALRRAAAAGLPAFVWTVNDERTLRRLLADDRVAAVITDAPERAVSVRSR